MPAIGYVQRQSDGSFKGSIRTLTPQMRDRWLTHMRDAIDSLKLAPQHDQELWSYMERAAYSMANTFDEHPGVTPGLQL